MKLKRAVKELLRGPFAHSIGHPDLPYSLHLMYLGPDETRLGIDIVGQEGDEAALSIELLFSDKWEVYYAGDSTDVYQLNQGLRGL